MCTRLFLCAMLFAGAWMGDCSFIADNLPFSISFLALNSFLNFKFRGLVLNL